MFFTRRCSFFMGEVSLFKGQPVENLGNVTSAGILMKSLSTLSSFSKSREFPSGAHDSLPQGENGIANYKKIILLS